jgi:hypothetical protein
MDRTMSALCPAILYEFSSGGRRSCDEAPFQPLLISMTDCVLHAYKVKSPTGYCKTGHRGSVHRRSAVHRHSAVQHTKHSQIRRRILVMGRSNGSPAAPSSIVQANVEELAYRNHVVHGPVARP